MFFASFARGDSLPASSTEGAAAMVTPAVAVAAGVGQAFGYMGGPGTPDRG